MKTNLQLLKSSFCKAFGLFVFFTFTSIAIFAQSDWQWQNPLPQGNSLTSVFFTDANTGYAVGASGTILKTTDGGVGWIAQTSGTYTELTAVFFPIANIGYAVGGPGTILKTTDGGTTWISQTIPTNYTGYTLLSVYFVNSDSGYVCGAGGSTLKTTDGGANWVVVHNGGNINTPSINSVYFFDANTGFAVGQDTTIRKTIDGGTTWVKQASGTSSVLSSIYFVNTDIGYIAGTNGTILKTIDGGTNWSIQTSLTTNNLYSVYFIDTDTGYAVGGSGTILTTTDGGINWVLQTSGIVNNLASVYFTNGVTGCAIGSAGTILITTDGGANWSKQGGIALSNSVLNSVYFTDINVGYAVGASGTIMKTNDGGTVWSIQTSGISNTLNSVYFTHADTGYTVGANGIILKTIDGGSVWSVQTSGIATMLNSVYFTNADTGYAVGASGKILKTIDGGNNWSAQTSGTTSLLRTVCFPDANTGYAVVGTFSGAVLKTTNGGIDWNIKQIGSGNIVYSVCFTDTATGYVAGQTGKIFKTTDGGDNWALQRIGGFILRSIYFTNANTGYAVGDLGRILKTTNGGENWVEQKKLTSNPLYSTYFISADTGYAVGYFGTIVSTTNGGCGDPLPIISSQPSNQIICEGSTASFNVMAAGNNLSYQWKKNNIDIFGATNSSFSINNVTLSDTGNYSCFIYTYCGNNVTSNSVILEVNSAITGSQTLILCAGDSVTVGANTYTATGVYTDILTGSNGCDSTVTTNLTIKQPTSGSQTFVECAGFSVTVGTNSYTATGVYTDILTGSNGCDSTVTTNLTIKQPTSSSQTFVECAGFSVTVGTNTYNTTGVYTDVLIGSNGCDSTVTTDLTVENAIDVSTTLIAETITANSTGEIYQWIDCNNGFAIIIGETSQSFTATANGNYAVEITQGSCSDTSVCVQITTVGIASIQTEGTAIYPNPVSNELIIETKGNKEKTDFEILNSIGQIVFKGNLTEKIIVKTTNFAPGVYLIKLENGKTFEFKKIIKE